MDLPDHLQIPKLKRQYARNFYLYSQRFLNINLFIENFFNKSCLFPGLLMQSEDRLFVLKARGILKRFIAKWQQKRRSFITKHVGDILPSVLCNLVVCFLM